MSVRKDWPITAAGLDLVEHAVQYEPPDADKAVTGAKVAEVEAEARDQAIEWIAEALNLSDAWAGTARALVKLQVHAELLEGRVRYAKKVLADEKR